MSLMGLTYGPLGTTLSELFPTRVRYTGSSLTFNMAGIFGASLAPYIATWLAQNYGLQFVGYYVVVAAVVTLFGLVASGTLGVVVALTTRPQPREAIAGLVNGTQLHAMEQYKGGKINRREGKLVYLTVETDPTLEGREVVQLSSEHLHTLAAEPGDLLYVCDRRWWLGGLHSIHLKATDPGAGNTARMAPECMAAAHLKDGDRVYVEKLF